MADRGRPGGGELDALRLSGGPRGDDHGGDAVADGDPVGTRAPAVGVEQVGGAPGRRASGVTAAAGAVRVDDSDRLVRSQHSPTAVAASGRGRSTAVSGRSGTRPRYGPGWDPLPPARTVGAITPNVRPDPRRPDRRSPWPTSSRPPATRPRWRTRSGRPPTGSPATSDGSPTSATRPPSEGGDRQDHDLPARGAQRVPPAHAVRAARTRSSGPATTPRSA